MADTAEHSDEIDLERARRARERAEARLKELSMDDDTHAKAHAALQRALVRMAAGGGE
jgi:F-type H+-transporting ATPase subunit epsilon